MSANSAARATCFIFRPSAASAGGVCVRSHRIPNAAAYRRHMSEHVPTRRAFLVDTLALVRGMEAHGIESKPTRRAFLVDTLALVRGMEAHGIESKHAEAITSAITVVLNDSLENVAESFISKGEMQKSMVIMNANLSKFKSEVQASQDHHFSLLQRATEKLRGDIDLLYGQIHHEPAKQIAEITKQIAETTKQIAEASDRISKQIAEASDRITKQIAEANDRITKQIAEAFDRTTKLDRVRLLSEKECMIRTTKLDREGSASG